jgi:hypothetical protein
MRPDYRYNLWQNLGLKVATKFCVNAHDLYRAFADA